MKNKILLTILILILMSTISAFGISSPYWEGNPLTIKPGETKTINLNLQNMVGNEDITVKAEIIQGKEIASLKQNTFYIKEKTSDTIIPLEISIPDNVKQENQKIEIDFKEISENKQGFVLGTGMSIAFDVIVNEQKEKNNLSLILVIGAILIITIIIAIKNKKIKF